MKILIKSRIYILCVLLLPASFAIGQGITLPAYKPVNQSVEKDKAEIIKSAFQDNKFVGGYLLYLNFFYDFNVVAMENRSSRAYKPKVSQRLINYYLAGLDDINESISEEYSDRGQARIDSAKYAEAMSDFDQALSYTPKNPDAYVSRATLFIFSHQYDEARAELAKAQKFDAKNAEVPFNRAVMYFDEGKLQEAQKEIDSSIALQPTYARAYFEKGLISNATGNTEEAIKNLRKARSYNDPDAGKVIRDIKKSLKAQPKPKS